MLPRPQGGATVKLQPANTAARYRQKRPKITQKKKKRKKNQINLKDFSFEKWTDTTVQFKPQSYFTPGL